MNFLTQRCLFEYSIERNDLTKTPFTYYVPGHLPKKIDEYRKRMKTLTVTHLTFSPNGSELLVNLGGEQLYLFNVLHSNINANEIKEFDSFRYDSFRDMFKKDSWQEQQPNTSETSSSSSDNSSAKAQPDKNQK